MFTRTRYTLRTRLSACVLQVEEAIIMMDSSTGRSRGFGFVTFGARALGLLSGFLLHAARATQQRTRRPWNARFV